MKGYKILIFILGLIAIIELLLLIKNKNESELLSDKDQHLKDSINILNTRLKISQEKEKKLMAAYDSLESIDPQIIVRTREKVKFIISDATPDELDSIIRSAATNFRPRYH